MYESIFSDLWQSSEPLGALLLQRDPPDFDFREILGEIFRWIFFAFILGGPILSRIFGGKEKKGAEKELEARRRRAEALRRQMQAQERAMGEAKSSPIPRQSEAAAAEVPGGYGGLAELGPEDGIERPWYELDENAAERESLESVLEREGPSLERKAVGQFEAADVTSIDDLAPISTLAETHFDSLASEFAARESDSLLLKGSAAQRRRRGVSRGSLRGAWRQAIVLREVLGTPVAMRSDREDLPGLR